MITYGQSILCARMNIPQRNALFCTIYANKKCEEDQ